MFHPQRDIQLQQCPYAGCGANRFDRFGNPNEVTTFLSVLFFYRTFFFKALTRNQKNPLRMRTGSLLERFEEVNERFQELKDQVAEHESTTEINVSNPPIDSPRSKISASYGGFGGRYIPEPSMTAGEKTHSKPKLSHNKKYMANLL